MPDIENSRKKTAEEGAEWVSVKLPEEQPKHPKNSCFDCFSGVLAVLPAVLPRPTWHLLRLFFFGCFQCRAFGTSVGGRRDSGQS